MTRRRILACRLDNAGDVLLSGPAVRALAAGGDVTLLAGPGGAAAGALLPGVAATMVFDAPWVRFDPEPLDRAAVDGLVEAIAHLAPDEAVVFTSFHQSPLPLALLLRLAGVPRIAATCVDYPGSLLDVRHPYREGVHEVEQQLSLAAAAGHPLPGADDGRLAVELGDVRSPVAGPGLAVLHAGASVPARGLPPPLAETVVPALQARGWRVVVTGTAGEGPLLTPLRRLSGVVDLVGRCSFAELGALLAAADVLVTGNTGPAHLAAAVGTPVVSVFAATVPVDRWRPWAVPSVVLGRDVPCAGCRERACPVPGQPCTDVTVGEVVAAVEELARPGRRRAA